MCRCSTRASRGRGGRSRRGGPHRPGPARSSRRPVGPAGPGRSGPGRRGGAARGSASNSMPTRSPDRLNRGVDWAARMPAASNESRLGLPASTGLVVTSSITTRSRRCMCGAAGAFALVDDAERLQVARLEAAAGDQPERAGIGVQQLHGAHVGGGDRDGGVHDLAEQRSSRRRVRAACSPPGAASCRPGRRPVAPRPACVR